MENLNRVVNLLKEKNIIFKILRQEPFQE